MKQRLEGGYLMWLEKAGGCRKVSGYLKIIRLTKFRTTLPIKIIFSPIGSGKFFLVTRNAGLFSASYFVRNLIMEKLYILLNQQALAGNPFSGLKKFLTSEMPMAQGLPLMYRVIHLYWVPKTVKLSAFMERLSLTLNGKELHSSERQENVWSLLTWLKNHGI